MTKLPNTVTNPYIQQGTTRQLDERALVLATALLGETRIIFQFGFIKTSQPEK